MLGVLGVSLIACVGLQVRVIAEEGAEIPALVDLTFLAPDDLGTINAMSRFPDGSVGLTDERRFARLNPGGSVTAQFDIRLQETFSGTGEVFESISFSRVLASSTPLRDSP